MIIDGFEIIIVKSKKRKKTLQALLVSQNKIRVLCPHKVTEGLLNDFIKKSVDKLSLKAKLPLEDNSLTNRANILKKKFIPEAPNFDIEYSATLRTTWGKCFFRERRIEINRKLKEVPLWVLDFIIIHEIAHLIYPNHGKEFRALVSRYRLKERATGFLIAKGMKATDI